MPRPELRNDFARAVARPVADRWASLVWCACTIDRDPKTLRDWARTVGLSYSSLREQCRLVGLKPRDARDFVRVLRALIVSLREDCAPEYLLDVSDRRTLTMLVQRAGFERASDLRGCSVSSFFERQRFVPSGSEALKALRSRATRC